MKSTAMTSDRSSQIQSSSKNETLIFEIESAAYTREIVPNIYRKEGEAQLEFPVYPENTIKTTRYTPWSFFPKTLLLQFTRAVNVFYLVNAILQSVPKISVNKPIGSILPLSGVIIVGILKELIVELKRWKDDKTINESLYKLVKA